MPVGPFTGAHLPLEPAMCARPALLIAALAFGSSCGTGVHGPRHTAAAPRGVTAAATEPNHARTEDGPFGSGQRGADPVRGRALVIHHGWGGCHGAAGGGDNPAAEGWLTWRHMPDEDLWAVTAPVEHGVKPVAHDVPESETPPDFPADCATLERIAPPPAPPFPTASELVGVRDSHPR